ncbi:MAG: mandelate racemase/muconate lactonizing enzyme family protein [Thioalkalivibrio sp.]
MHPDSPLVPNDPLLPPDSRLPDTGPVQIMRLEVFVFRAPIEAPVITSFGEMRDRPAVLVRLEDQHGAQGWGEVWCNFPACGAEHRARLLESVLAPRLINARFGSVTEATRSLEVAQRVLAVQTAEWGPLAQCLAGIDIALWDLAARRAGKPLARLLGAEGVLATPVYASGINPDDVPRLLESSRARGYRAFKVKVGFGRDADLASVAAARAMLGPGERLMLDANQAWDPREALTMAEALAAFAPDFLEEPMPADRSLEDWRRLAAASPIPLAGGENLRGAQVFDQVLQAGILQVLQPDMCKWGGFTGCLPVARAILKAGKRYCPHFLGAGIGLMASAHLLAAAGGDGLLEVDANPNPLREMLGAPFPKLDAQGRSPLTESPGLGVAPDLEAARQWQVQYLRREA